MAKSIPRDHLSPLLDIDHLLYVAGFAADTQAKERWGAEGYLAESYETWAYGNANTYLDKLLSQTFKCHEWARLFIGGEGNYRNNIAKTLPSVIKCDNGKTWKYKGGRDALHKPRYYNELKNYLVDKWGAIRVDGREADDMVSILQYARADKSTCIVGVDKDLRLCPGWHHHPKKETFEYISLKEADINFRLQCLTGDWGSDYIPGLTGIGEKKAAKLVKECDYDLREIDRKTLQLYNSEFGPELGQAVLTDNKNLLWLQREEWKGFDGRDLSCYR